jgi:hypothetical protein
MQEEGREEAGGRALPEFGEVFAAVRRVVEARGVRQERESLITYTEAGITLSRTPINEYEVRSEGGVVFRARHTGSLSSAPAFEPGAWVEEVMRMDMDIRRGRRK